MADQIFLTPEGLQKITTELTELKTKRRKEVSARIEAALKLGDLSENAEYHDAKDEKAWIESRVNELEAMITHGIVMQGNTSEKVSMGSTVTIKGSIGEKTYVLVGDNEADPSRGKITGHSPLGSALFGKKIGDSVEVTAPAGKISYTIVKIL